MWAAERVEQKKWRRDEEQRAAREDLIGRVGGSGGEEGPRVCWCWPQKKDLP